MIRTDVITFGCLVSLIPIYAFREAWVGYRGERTISQVARDVGWWFSAFVYFWSAMPFHWWVWSPFAQVTWKTVVFWVIQAALLAWNVAWWRICIRPLRTWPRWLMWVNFPPWYVFGGQLAAWLLFPQRQVLPWAL